MMPIYLHSQAEIAEYLQTDPYLHLYALGDLDDFFWPYTTWIADREEGRIRSLILVYSGGGLPVVLAIAEKERDCLRELLSAAAAQPLLPRRFYTHLSPGLANIIAAAGYRLEPHGRYLKMALKDPAMAEQVDTSAVVRLSPEDEPALRRLYDEAYPGNWFDPRMLQTGCFFGVRRDNEVISVAGIHVFSPVYRAAALGNICTQPEYRNQGLGTAVTACLVQRLRGEITFIGLNVRVDNIAAQASYTRLGFVPVAEYEEYMVSEG
jgi:ribosomal protein S18 acetylase RimI-like enzyme